MTLIPIIQLNFFIFQTIKKFIAQFSFLFHHFKKKNKLKNRFNYNLTFFHHQNKSTQLMSSDQQVAFDNWEEAAEELQKEEQVQKQEESVPTQQQQPKQEISDEIKQQNKAQKAPQDPKEILKKKIAAYQTMSFEEFDSLSQQITEQNKATGKKVGNPVLKSDKDFNNYARILAKRFDSMVQNQDATIDDDKMSLFFEELTLYMYQNLEWKNFHEIQSKLKVIKKERKTEEDKRRKQKEKQERLKKVQAEGSESKSVSVTQKQKKEEDLFGGVTNINSKELEEERKNKIITEEPKKQDKKEEEEEDDDDFM